MLPFNKLNKDIVKLVAKKNYFNRKERSNEKAIEQRKA